MKITAVTIKGLEEVLAQELIDLGAKDIEIMHRAVGFHGDQEMLYKANFWLRTAIRVLVPIHEFTVRDEEDLYNKVFALPWDEYMDIDQTFSIDAVVSSHQFTHSKYIALKTKDALVDKWRKLEGRRPDVNTLTPDVKIHVRIYNSEVTVSLDSSSDSLHRRGYRTHSVPAPINEVLAAGMILLSGWDKKTTFLDPMCGSGTIAMEALTLAAGRPPQDKDRRFGFKQWKDFDSDLWDKVTDVEVDYSDLPKIIARDRGLRPLKATEMNIAHLDWLDYITVEKSDFFRSEQSDEKYHIVMNPPYDERLKERDITEFYQFIGDTLKSAYAGSEAWVIAGHEDALKSIGLRASRRISLMNGPIPSKFCKFEMYVGTRKTKVKDKSDKDYDKGNQDKRKDRGSKDKEWSNDYDRSSKRKSYNEVKEDKEWSNDYDRGSKRKSHDKSNEEKDWSKDYEKRNNDKSNDNDNDKTKRKNNDSAFDIPW